ncbi:MAG: tyrosine-type recombinase/integrase [Micropruina sp.]|uniref:tyrosine-type recombinase/integrase n=1 Tax=Micropruina sp. TaxID=2737536 RepID=UPI0039E297C4
MPSATTKRRSRGVLGAVRRLPSGRFQASYRHDGERFTAPYTFDTREAANGWLAAERADRALGSWRDPRLGQVSLDDYARGWLAARTDLAPRTRDLYGRLLDARVLPAVGDPASGRLALGRLPLVALTPALIRTWFARMSADCARDAARPTRRRPANSTHGPNSARAWAIAHGYPVKAQGRLPDAVLRAWETAGQPEPGTGPRKGRTGRTTAAQAYRLLHAILATAVTDGLIVTNPAMVKGAGTVHHPERETATPAEVAQLADLMPAHLSAAVWLAAWSGLRRGELLGLARRHVDLSAGTVRVERSLGLDRQLHRTKTRQSVRTVWLPAPVVQLLAEHLARHVDAGPDALLFTSATGRPVAASNLLTAFHRARQAIGRPSLTWHDLRHTGATLAYQAGGSVRDVQHRLGHATERAAMIYAHTSDQSGKLLADRLGAMFWPDPDRPEPTSPDSAPATAARHGSPGGPRLTLVATDRTAS